MIPKIIHYCWFGGAPLPELAIRCIDSWRNYFPDYEIKEWNENNFDLDSCSYVKEAYHKRKWAFVSDYARFWIIYHYGGLYFDTDVEIIKPMNNIIDRGSFFGMEPTGNVNPGLGFAAYPEMELYKEILTFYEKLHFINQDGTLNDQTVVKYITDILLKHGFILKNKMQTVCGITIYPSEYFCPQNYETGVISLNENTVSIHHYTASWHSSLENIITTIERCKSGKISLEYRFRRIISLPFRIVNKYQHLGTRKMIKFIFNKYL